MKQATETKTRKRVPTSAPQSKLSSSSRNRRPSKSSSASTSRADILISIKPVFMDRIVKRMKNHEFRKYLLSNTVRRMWLYVSSPDQTLRYIATISHGKQPGEIQPALLDGMGSADFNAGQKDEGYAYEIEELYELKDPLSLKAMQERYGATFPQRFTYVLDRMIQDIVLKDQIRLF